MAFIWFIVCAIGFIIFTMICFSFGPIGWIVWFWAIMSNTKDDKTSKKR